jgi:hypothetical protein
VTGRRQRKGHAAPAGDAAASPVARDCGVEAAPATGRRVIHDTPDGRARRAKLPAVLPFVDQPH